MKQQIRQIFLILVVCLISLNILNPVLAQDTETPDVTTETYTLSIKSEPTGATVVVDHSIKGVTPIDVKVTKGKHLVRIAVNQNWHPYIKNVEVNGDGELNVKLTPVTQFSYKEGKKSFNSKNWQAAKEHFTNAVDPKRGKVTPEAYFYLALLDRRKADYTDMEKNLKEFINYNPTAGDFSDVYPRISEARLNYAVQVSYFLLGQIYQDRYKWAEAATVYKLSIPDHRNFINRKIKPSYKEIQKYRAITKKEPDNYRALIQLGFLYEMKGKLFQAMLTYRDASKTLYKKSPAFMKKYSKFLEW